MNFLVAIFSNIKKLVQSPPAITDDSPFITDASEEYEDILEAAAQEAHAQLYEAGVPVQIGYTEIFHQTKRHILKEKYGLNWKPPG